VPADTPVTTPVVKSTVATDVLVLVHVPPVVALLSVVVDATQVNSVPVMEAGGGLTVTTAVARHPAVW
jgi:hypothetical protein